MLTNGTIPQEGDIINLLCEVLCANPLANFVFNWTIEAKCSDGSLNRTEKCIQSDEAEDTLFYEIPCNYNKIFVTCLVNNGILNDEEKEFATYEFIG